MKGKLLKILTLILTILSSNAISPMLVQAYDKPHWEQMGNNWYYHDGNGGVKMGWFFDNGYWYFCGTNGAMKTGWIIDNGNWYYLYSNGQMAKNTTIDGCYLNDNGAWTSEKYTNCTALTGDDVNGNNHLRTDRASREIDYKVAETLSNYNIALDWESDLLLTCLTNNIEQGKLPLDEAKNKCIGKIVNSKYKITDIKLLQKDFPKGTSTFFEDELVAIKDTDVYKYKPTTQYTYDKYSVCQYSTTSVNSWTVIRIVIECEAI